MKVKVRKITSNSPIYAQFISSEKESAFLNKAMKEYEKLIKSIRLSIPL